MFKKKYMVLLLFLIALIYAVSAVSAEDFNATDELISQETDDEIAVNNEDVLNAGIGTYKDLSKKITSNYKGEVNLYKDYAYDEYYDDNAGIYNSISIEKSITIYGNGHTIYANDANPFLIKDSAKVKIYNLTFYGDYSSNPVTSWGGAINNWGNLYLENCNFINCKSKDAGGAICNSGNLNLVNCIFINCQTKNEGGAIFNQWIAKINGCVFYNNSVTKSKSNGGAIFNDLDLFINCSIFVENNAKDKGGAIYTDSDAWIQNSIFGTFIGNESEDEGDLTGENKANIGASIYNEPGKFCTVVLCFFNETQENSDVEVVSNVIAINSYFNDNNIITGGVIKNCTTNQTLSTTINSTGFILQATPSIDTYYKSGQKLEVTVTSNPTGERVSNIHIELIIDGDYTSPKTIVTNASGVATYKASALEVGNHNILVRLYNSTFSNQQITVPVTVKKTEIAIQVSKFITTYKSGEEWIINVTDVSNNKPAANVEIYLKIYSGSKYEYYSEKTDSNGIATFKPSNYYPELNKGTHNVVLSPYDTTNYYGKSITSSIKVKAHKLTIFGVSNKFKDCGQMIFGVYSKTKKKYVSGITLKIQIYTGKKYKTFKLVTKKSKILGNIGVLIETNKFSAGKHKVVVKVATPNYKGSTKLKLVIPKSAKKYTKFTYVITKGKGKYV